MLKADRYKEKKCVVCGTLHKKRYDVCSKECGNTRRGPASEETKRAISEGIRKWKETSQGELTTMNLRYRDKEEEVAILPPEFIDTPYTVEDGDVWTLA